MIAKPLRRWMGYLPEGAALRSLPKQVSASDNTAAQRAQEAAQKRERRGRMSGLEREIVAQQRRAFRKKYRA